MIKRISILLLALVPTMLWAQFAPEAGVAGTTAMHADSSAFVAWATGCTVERGPQQIDSLSRIASSFSSFAKLPEVAPAQVDIAAKLYQVITLFRNNSEHVPIRYVGAEQGVMGIADGEQIGQVFNNLLKNALQAISGRKNGDIIVMLKELPEELEISISDNGGGIPEDVQEKVFMPNFTTKSTGAGLGLAISKNIVEAGGGTISFTTTKKGTTFYVRIRK